MLVEILTPDFVHSDERGHLTQLVRKGFSQFNVITSKKGCIRGGHYHKLNDEAFFIISGCVKLTLKNGNEQEEYIFETNNMFRILPFVCHDFEFLEDTVLISMYSFGVELPNGDKDIYASERV